MLHLMVGARAAARARSPANRPPQVHRAGRNPCQPGGDAGRPPLSNTVGFVLDPIVSLRHTVSLPPYGTAVWIC